MKQVLVVCVFVCGLTALATPAPADWQPGDPYKMHYPQLPDPFGWDVKATRPKILADDFRCTQTGPITDVHFWGSWKNDQIGQITNVHLSIHADIPAGGTNYSRPGELLWYYDMEPSVIGTEPASPQGWYDPNTGFYQQNNHNLWYQYNLYIPEAVAFRQQKGTIYWLDIQTQTINGVWGWKTSLQHWNDDAVWGDWTGGDPNQILWHELRDPITGQSLDLAFVITPEPASLSLLALGGLALLRRRR